MDINVDTTQFDRVLRHTLDQLVPERLVEGINAGAKELRRELVAASPRGPEPAPGGKRAQQRARRGRGYGPIWRAWRTKRAKLGALVATVWNAAFYAPLIEYGSSTRRARPFVKPVAARAGSIVLRAIHKLSAKWAAQDRRAA